jgi:3-oxoadipate enol-lactonase
MAYADVNGQRIAYDDTGGSGLPVVFAHGFLMDRSMFAPQVDALAGEFRCISFDERGWGGTEFDGEPFTYWDLAEDAVGLMDALDLPQATLAGMSQGGFLGLRAALAHPGRVRALVLIDTQSGVEDPANQGAYDAMRDEWVTNGPQDPLATAVAGIILGSDEAVTAPWIAKWQAAPKEMLSVPFACLSGRDDVTDRLGEIDCPALVIHGTADAAIPMGKAEELCERLPNCAGLVRVEGGTHASNLTHPEQVNAPLLEFLRKYA